MRVFPVSPRGQLGPWEPQACLGQACWTSPNPGKLKEFWVCPFLKYGIPAAARVHVDSCKCVFVGDPGHPLTSCVWHWYSCGNTNISLSKALTPGLRLSDFFFLTMAPYNVHFLGKLCKWMVFRVFSISLKLVCSADPLVSKDLSSDKILLTSQWLPPQRSLPSPLITLECVGFCMCC